jgi:hypothetical protein
VGRIQRALEERKLLGQHEPGSLDAPTAALPTSSASVPDEPLAVNAARHR